MDGIWAIGIIAVAVVAPLALILHYVTQWRSMKTLSSDDELLLDDLWRTAQALEKRVQSLETILDKEAPAWRERNV